MASVAPNWQPVLYPLPWLGAKVLSILSKVAKGYLNLDRTFQLLDMYDLGKHLLFPAVHHVRDDKCKFMMAECCKGPCLVKNTPHMIGDLLMHIFSLLGTRVVVWVLYIYISMNTE